MLDLKDPTLLRQACYIRPATSPSFTALRSLKRHSRQWDEHKGRRATV